MPTLPRSCAPHACTPVRRALRPALLLAPVLVCSWKEWWACRDVVARAPIASSARALASPTLVLAGARNTGSEAWLTYGVERARYVCLAVWRRYCVRLFIGGFVLLVRHVRVLFLGSFWCAAVAR